MLANDHHHTNSSRSDYQKTEKSPLISGADPEPHIEDLPPQSKFVPIPSFWNTVKAFAGAGSFALPWAVMQAGIWIGVIGLVLIAILSNYTMNILLKCSIKMKEDQVGPEKPSYADIAHRAFGRVGELFVCFMNFSVTMSICISYLILIGVNFGELIPLKPVIIIWIVLPVLVLLTCLTDMKYLGFTSIFGALSLILAMATVVAYGIRDNEIHPLDDYTFKFENIPLWFGNAAFFFCNHIVVIPISHASGDNKRYPKVLDIAMIFITTINCAFALICYLYYNFIPGGVPANIVAALPNGTFSNIVRLCVVFELACSFPLVFGAGLNVVDSSIKWFHDQFNAFPNQQLANIPFFSKNWKFYIVRLFICAALAAIASTIKNFGSYTSLIGSLMLAIAGFVVPPLLSLRFFPEQKIYWKVFHVIITAFGIGATVLGTYDSLKELIQG